MEIEEEPEPRSFAGAQKRRKQYLGEAAVWAEFELGDYVLRSISICH